MAGCSPTLEELNRKVTECRICERLTRYRELVPPRRSFAGSAYWRKPVPSFGDPGAWLMIVGLAPAAHGGNRTGRVFTGDESGRFLVEALHATGFANQPVSISRDDGLVLTGCYIMAAVKCVPPDNKPAPQEFASCRGYLVNEMKLLTRATHVLTLGKMAFRAYLDAARQTGLRFEKARFKHGASYKEGGTRLYGSFHPSPRNTYTGKLTRGMFIGLLDRIKKDKTQMVRRVSLIGMDKRFTITPNLRTEGELL